MEFFKSINIQVRCILYPEGAKRSSMQFVSLRSVSVNTTVPENDSQVSESGCRSEADPASAPPAGKQLNYLRLTPLTFYNKNSPVI